MVGDESVGPQAKATWHIGPFDDSNYSSKRTNEYIFEIPENWANTYVGGKRLACGKGDGCGSAGVRLLRWPQR